MASTGSASELRRTLGVGDAVVIGLGSMVGAGIFAALGPAARAAGSGLLLGLAVAAVVAYCNATASARLASLYPASGGTYVYGRERLGPFWGYLAGWSFVVGKTASCAAMALTVGAYVWPAQAHAVAVAAVVALTAVNYGGVQKSAWLTRVIVAVVLAVLASVVVVCLGSRAFDAGRLGVGISGGVGGVLQAAGLLFFAFAGYARIATLGEEVRDPARTIPRAIPVALGIALAVYVCVAVAVLSLLGAEGLGRAGAPLADAVRVAGVPGLVPVVRVGAAVAALGSLLALILGVSRTTLAMARDRSSARRAVRRASAFPGAAQGRTGRGCGGRRPGRHGGRTGRDRILLLRCAGVLRRRQCLGLDAQFGSHYPSAAGGGSCRMCGAGLLSAGDFSAHGRGRVGGGCGRVWRTSVGGCAVAGWAGLQLEWAGRQ